MGQVKHIARWGVQEGVGTQGGSGLEREWLVGWVGFGEQYKTLRFSPRVM